MLEIFYRFSGYGVQLVHLVYGFVFRSSYAVHVYSEIA